MTKYLLFSILLLLSNLSFSQSFPTLTELLELSKKSPIDIEKTLKLKGFTFIGALDDYQEFNKSDEAVGYELVPRVLTYFFPSREYYLEYYSFMENSGYTISADTVPIESEYDEIINAQLFEKGKAKIYLYHSHMSDSIQTYTIDLYPYGTGSDVSSPKASNGSKESISFGNMYVALMSPRSKMDSEPGQNTTISQDYQGLGGMGASAGFEVGISGIVGMDLINNRLPFYIDFGLSLKLMGGLQPFSYASLGAPFDDYDYSSFAKVGGGGGPAIVISPLKEIDFKLIFYYDFLPSASLGGAIKYDGPIPDFNQTIARESASFALVRAFGFSLKYQNVLLGIESSTYIDKGSFENKYGYTGNILTESFEAKLPVNQLILKLAFCF